MSRKVAVIDWSLRNCSERIRFYRAVEDTASLAIELAVADRLLDERNAIPRSAGGVTPAP